MSKFINNKSGIFSRLTDGYMMFRSSQLTSFNTDMPALRNGYMMFAYSQLTSFNTDISALTNGYQMFGYSQLTSFNADLPNVTELGSAFYYCSRLKTLNINAPKCNSNYNLASYSNVETANIILKGLSGSTFYGCSNLRNVTVNASDSSCINNIFSDCRSLECVNGNVDVTSAQYAFNGCSKLRDISFSFENMNSAAWNMLKGCTSLNGECVKRIVKSLPKLGCAVCPDQAAIHIDFDPSTLPEEEWIDCIIELLSKGWTVATDTSYNNYYY